MEPSGELLIDIPPITRAPPPSGGPGKLVRLFGTFRLLPHIFMRRVGFEWAAALAFHTLLALIPLVIIAFSLLGFFQDWFDLDTGLEQMLIDQGLPDAAKQAGTTIRDIVARVRSSSTGLGAIGFVFLLYTALGLFSTLEIACNALWNLRPPARLLRRLRSFLITLVLGPLLFGLSLFATARLQILAADMRDEEWVGPVLKASVIGAPFLITWTAFYFLTSFVPSVKVHRSSAILGAVVAGSVWEIAKWSFNLYVAHSTQIDTLYGPLGILPLFIIWVQVTWIVALLGVQIANIHQTYPALVEQVRARKEEHKAREAAGKARIAERRARKAEQRKTSD